MTAASERGIGARPRRREDERHLLGRGRFVADFALQGLREVAFCRSPVAHGRIRAIRKPGQAEDAVFTRGDLAAVRPIAAHLAMPGFRRSTQPPLAEGRVRYVGEPVAMCVGGSRAEAEDLAEAVQIEIEELSPLADAATALGSAERIHPDWPDNVFLDMSLDGGIAAVADAPVVVKRRYRTARQVMNPIEGSAVLAWWDERPGQLVVCTSTQVPHMIRQALAELLGLAQEAVRVIAPDVGGGFGYKCVLRPEELCVAWLALTRRTAFRWVEDRREHLVAGANCREHAYEITAYADRRGRLLGLDADILIDGGAYSVWPFTAALEGTMAAGHLPGPYDIGRYRARSRTVATNKPAFVPYRGVARTGITFAMELTIDAVARAVGREPWEVRRDNLVRPEQMPYTNPTRKVYDSGDYPRSLAMAVDRIDLPRWRREQAAPRADGRLLGVGFAQYIEMTAHGTELFAAVGYPFIPGHEQAAVRFTPDGGLEIRAGVHAQGQGLETTLAQIAQEVLGVDMDRVQVVLGDTAMTPYSTGTYASRSVTMAGGAVARGCRELRDRLLRIGARLLDCDAAEIRWEDGAALAPTGRIGRDELVRAWYLEPHRLKPPVEPGGLEVTAGYKPAVDSGQYSYGTHAAVVAIDPGTGAIEILDYVVVEDCGTMVNPAIVEGQAVGGTVQGIGTALFEEAAYDRSGQPLRATLADYLLPAACEMPTVRMFHLETPSPNTEFGIKGCGEGGAIPPPAAILNAVNDALRPLGIELSEAPVTPPQVLAALRGSAGPTAVPAAASTASPAAAR